jgi:hypothetical protein
MWIGSLPFNGHLCLPSKDFCASLEMNHNLFEYTSSSLYKGPMKFIVRCSPLLYPIVGGFGKDSGGQKLITDTCQAARSHGSCALISNGSNAKACKDQRVLLCSNGCKYHHRLEGSKAPGNTYCVTTYIGKKKLNIPIFPERHCNDTSACNTIQVALGLQRLSSDCTSTAFI